MEQVDQSCSEGTLRLRPYQNLIVNSEILRQVYGGPLRLCDWTMPKPSVVMPDLMMDEIDDRRHSRTDRSEWIRGAIQARLDAEDRGDWEECAPGDIHD